MGKYETKFKLQSRLSLSMLPLALPLGAWKLSLLVNSALGCHAVGKKPQACLVMDVDVQPVLALGAWWGMLLWVPGLVLRGLLVGQVLAGRLPRPWGRGDAR